MFAYAHINNSNTRLSKACIIHPYKLIIVKTLYYHHFKTTWTPTFHIFCILALKFHLNGNILSKFQIFFPTLCKKHPHLPFWLIVINLSPSLKFQNFKKLKKGDVAVWICKLAHLPMTQFWSTDSALHKWPSPHSSMLMSKVKAEAVWCLQVGFPLFKHCASIHISHFIHSSSPVHISHHLAAYHHIPLSHHYTYILNISTAPVLCPAPHYHVE